MKKLIASLFFVVLFGSVCAQQSSPSHIPSDLEDRLVAKSNETISILCKFRQTKHMSVMAKPIISEGTFYYKQPDRISMDYDIPTGDKLVMNTDKFLIIANGRRNVADAGSNPMMKALKQMLSACMSGNIRELVKGGKNTLSVQEDAQNYVLTLDLDKKKTRGTLKRIILSFDRHDLSLSEMVMEEFSGDYTRYEFSSKKFNTDIDDSHFVI